LKKLFRSAVGLTLFVIMTFVAMDFFIDIDNIDDKQIASKIQLFKNQKKADIIFFGSSVIATGINCAIIDSLTERTSFNLGIPGIHGHMKLELVKQLVKKAYIPSGATLVIETGFYFPFGTNYTPEGLTTSHRFLYLYTTKHFLQDFALLYQANFFSTSKKLTYFWSLITYYFNSRNKFVLASKQYQSLSPQDLQSTLKAGARGEMHFHENGYTPYVLEHYKAETIEKQQKINTRLEGITAEMQENIQIAAQDNPLGDIFLGRYKDLATFLKNHNIQLVVFSHPIGGRTLKERLVGNRLNHVGIPYVNFESMDKYPFLYDFDNYFDPGHLNQKGTVAFSIAMAAELNSFTKK